MRNLLVLFAISVSLNCSNELGFERLEKFSSITESANFDLPVLRANYLIYNYNKSNQNEILIDEYFCSMIAESKNQFSFIDITFYKTSSITSVSKLNKRPHGLEGNFMEKWPYFEDRLWSYSFNFETENWRKYRLKGNRHFENYYPSCLKEKYPN